MKYSESLKKNREFSIVYHEGKSFANRYLVMYRMENNLKKNRLGISVSKKVGNSVVRHQIKRYIKEGYRLNEARFARGYDLVVIARASAKEKNFHELESALLHLGRLHKIVDQRNQK